MILKFIYITFLLFSLTVSCMLQCYMFILLFFLFFYQTNKQTNKSIWIFFFSEMYLSIWWIVYLCKIEDIERSGEL